MEVISSCETPADIHWTAQRYIPEDRNLVNEAELTRPLERMQSN
jgi:hypothetical protein